MKRTGFVRPLLLLAALSWGGLLFAQQTGTLLGKVSTAGGDPLPGVVISIESPSLQGRRNAVSNETGDFLFRLLPPGVYTITSTMPGMQTQKQDFRVSVNQATRARITMDVEQQTDVIVVTADRVFELDSTAVASNFENDFVEKLPRARDVNSVARLAPGVTTGGIAGIEVLGSRSTDNKYLINGALVNGDNIRGGVQNLFIQDDIAETQVLTGNVSAEYGGFSGGLINTVTKSGGNDFHGTLRMALRRGDWTARNPIQVSNNDQLSDSLDKIYTLTFNGPIIKDRLWFAVSGRQFNNDNTANLVRGTPLSDAQAQALNLPTGQTGSSGLAFQQPTERERFQVKLTGSLWENHTVVGSYLEDDFSRGNRSSFNVLSQDALTPQFTQPSTLFSLNYRGIITPSFTVDANYSSRELTLNEGISTTDRIAGTLLQHRDQGQAQSNSPFQSGDFPDKRNSDNWTLKLSYFFSSGSLGSHDLVFGLDEVREERETNNAQSSSGWQLWPLWTRFEGEQPIPIFTPGSTGSAAWIVYWPLVNPSQGNDFTTQSAFVNDVWTLNEKWYFNIGVRFDKNDTKAEDGQDLSSDSRFSPRLSANYDLHGDGRHQFSAGYNQYLAKLDNAAQRGSTAGSPALFAWRYQGPQTESIAEVFAWIDANFSGGIAGVEALDLSTIINEHLFARNFSPDTSPENLAFVVQEGGLESAGVEEFTFGYKHKIGSRGFIKGDFVYRDYNNFLSNVINQTTGQTQGGNDRTVITNDDDNYERTYKGLLVSGNYQLNPEWIVGGNYTLSESEGNIVGETTGSGAVSTGSLTAYPEFNHPRLAPSGNLPGDSTHNLRVWTSYDLNTSFGTFSFSGIHTWTSGTPYQATAALDIQGRETQFGLPDPSTLPYATPPTTLTYFISDRGALEWDDFHGTDFSTNYTYEIFNRFEFFVQISLFNIFNNDAQLGGNTTVNANRMTAFNVFSETPVAGTHYQLGPNFGRPTTNGHFQNGRTFNLDLGLRF